MHRLIILSTTAMTLWLLAMVMWLACTNQATTAQTATHAAQTLLKPIVADDIRKPQQAIMALEAAAVNPSENH